MKKKFKKLICSIITLVTVVSVSFTVPVLPVFAKESIGNGLILSTDMITITENSTAAFTALMAEGFDASRLACVVADPAVANVTPGTCALNAAAFQVTYQSAGTTVAAVYSIDNPAVVAYVTINATPVIMDIPSKLGTNRDNYCSLVSYEFVPYDFPYADFQDYKCTLNIKYQCVSYKDDDYNRWGCYGYFYDAEGNVLSKVHLYASSLSKGRIYHSEFNVPANAVRFSIESFETARKK
jgi:hypothetical protein